ncbi:Putative ribonuclease H protein At1g65750 [Linum perenne]
MIQQVTGMIPPAAGRGDDVLNWGEEPNGKFSIRSAYCLTLQFDHQPLDIDWKHVWRWKGPTAIINWDPGPEGWITLNTDGSVNRATGVATIGGLLRNHLGFCSLAFTAKLGKCSITRAELRGIIQGLELAWNEGHKKVSVQTDSLAAVLLIRAEGAPSHQHTSEIIAIKNWTDRDWQVEFHHTYREANGAADFLATLGHNFAIGVHIIPTSDCNLGYFLRKDCMRIAELRSIPLIN